MKFRVGALAITLQGDPSLSKTLVSLKAMMKEFRKNKQGMLLELGTLAVGQAPHQWEIPSEISGVLAEFDDVFSTPEGLPSRRNKDHAINLILGTQPVSVRHYRYPYLQKNEIETLVGEMLAAGII